MTNLGLGFNFHPVVLGGRIIDMIYIEGLEVTASHGVYEFERQEFHPFRADLAVWVDTQASGLTDQLNLTVSYADVAIEVEKVLAGQAVNLLETLAQRVADQVLQISDLVLAVDVRISKPEAPLMKTFKNVGVVIRRFGKLLRKPGQYVKLPEQGSWWTPSIAQAVLALGANEGDREMQIKQALANLAANEQVISLQAAPLQETKALILPGMEPQPNYLNTVVLLTTSYSPWELLDFCHLLEIKAGRKREERWGKRMLDVDLINYTDPNGCAIKSRHPRLQLPHPEAKKRDFVLRPWVYLDPQAKLENGLVSTYLADLETS